jgi:hypothetical protein
MSDLVTSLLREAAQKLVGMAVVWLLAHGLSVPSSVSDWAVLALITGGLFLWTALVRLLESLPGFSWLAKVLMLGIGKRPSYAVPPPSAPAGVTGTYVGNK